MNCSSVRNRILAKTHPEKLPASYKAHVNTCQACQTWHQQLLAMQEVVSSVAVPASSVQRKADFIQQFTTDSVPQVPEVVPAVVEVSKPTKANKPKSTPKVKLAPSGKAKKSSVEPAKSRQPLSERLTRMWPAGIAAVLVLGGAVIWSMKGGNGPTEVAASQPDPMLEKTVSFKVKYDTAKNDSERMNYLLKFSNDLGEQAKTLAKVAAEDDMKALAKMYDQIVREMMVQQCRALDTVQNKQVLTECINQLGNMEQTANRLAEEGVNSGSDKPLREIAAAAKEGKEKIAQHTLGKGL